MLKISSFTLCFLSAHLLWPGFSQENVFAENAADTPAPAAHVFPTPAPPTSAPLPSSALGSREVSESSSSSAGSQEAADAARLERRRIISDLDAKALSAKRSHHVSVSILPVLERCAPMGASVADCKAAAAEASAELDRKIERASREKSQVPPTSPPQPINVTIIEHRDTYIVRSNRVIVPPSGSSTEAPETPAPPPRKNPLPHIKSKIFK